MNLLTYLNENKTTLVVAMSGAVVADCLVLLALRRYFTKYSMPFDDALEGLRADVESLRSEVLTLRAIVNELSGGSARLQLGNGDSNGEPRCYNRSRGFWGNSASVVSLSSEGSYFDAVDEWFDAKPSERFVYDSEKISKLLAEVDSILEQQNGAAAYSILKDMYDTDLTITSNTDVLWRLAKACHSCANTFDKKDSERKRFILEGKGYAVRACELNEDCFEAVRWAAVLVGLSTDFVGMKERVKLGGQFKEYLDKALAMQPSDVSLLHMRGRYSYTVANLSWLERKAASALFGAVPQATIDEALDDLLAVERLKSEKWIDNLLFVALCYIAKKDDVLAVKYLMMASELQPQNDAEEESFKEVNVLLGKYAKQ